MSVVERIGAVVNESAEKTKKQKKPKKKPKPKLEAAPAVEPQPFDLNVQRLKALGVYTPADHSAQLALELRAVKRRLLRRVGFLRESGDRLTGRRGGRQKNLIMMTSTRAGEGKTFSALNLALSFAFEDQIETLLVDADVHRPKILNRLGLERGPGLTEKLADPSIPTDSLLYRANEAPLSVLPQGSTVDRLSDLFHSSEAKSFWADLSAGQPDRLIIIDAPPVLATTEAVILAKYVDEIVFVVEAGGTTEQAIAAALDEILDINPNVSLMLNRCLIGSGGSHYGSYEYYDRRDDGEEGAKSGQES